MKNLLLSIFVFFTSFAISQCTHTIKLTDTFGDGWNGGAVSVSVNGVTVDSTTKQRWEKLKQEGKLDLALQARINDTCPNLVLQTVLENYPKARTGSYPNYKLKEDSTFGPGTEAAAKACKPHFGKSQTASVQATGQGTTIAEPKIGEPLTANDIATSTK